MNDFSTLIAAGAAGLMLGIVSPLVAYYVHDGRLKLTSGIGKIINPRIDTISGKLQEQDLVLMTTDGIHYALRPDAMSEIILNSPPEGTEATNALVNAAKNIVKYPDNMSAMLIYMPSGFL